MCAERDEARAQWDLLVVEREKLLEDKIHHESMLKVNPIPEMVIKDYEKFENFVDFSLDTMKSEIEVYLKLLVNDARRLVLSFPYARWGYFVILWTTPSSFPSLLVRSTPSSFRNCCYY